MEANDKDTRHKESVATTRTGFRITPTDGGGRLATGLGTSLGLARIVDQGFVLFSVRFFSVSRRDGYQGRIQHVGVRGCLNKGRKLNVLK